MSSKPIRWCCNRCTGPRRPGAHLRKRGKSARNWHEQFACGDRSSLQPKPCESSHPLSDRDRSDGGSRRALNLERLQNERELVNPLRRHFIKFQILEKMNAVDDEHDLMDRQRDLRVGVWIDLDRGVSAPTTIGF